jgi:hypothetical protein
LLILRHLAYIAASVVLRIEFICSVLLQEDLLIHGDSVYDIIDKQDHQAIQTELVRSATGPGDEERMFLCRMNVSRNARRQMRFGDQKVRLSTYFVHRGVDRNRWVVK